MLYCLLKQLLFMCLFKFVFILYFLFSGNYAKIKMIWLQILGFCEYHCFNNNNKYGSRIMFKENNNRFINLSNYVPTNDEVELT